MNINFFVLSGPWCTGGRVGVGHKQPHGRDVNKSVAFLLKYLLKHFFYTCIFSRLAFTKTPYCWYQFFLSINSCFSLETSLDSSTARQAFLIDSDRHKREGMSILLNLPPALNGTPLIKKAL